METVELPNGSIRYRTVGPQSESPPVVFVHGLLVNGALWTETALALAAAGIRSHAPDWPLGSHTTPLPAGADRSPAGMARLIISFLEALDLRDVTLVGNDTGGALCQLVLDTDASRVGRIVLTNCDAFEQFPPPPFGLLVAVLKRPALTRALFGPMRMRAIRHSPIAYGPLTVRALDSALTLEWAMPSLSDAAIRRDLAGFAEGIGATDLRPVSERLDRFGGPALIVWGTRDRFFKPELGRRLAATFSTAKLIELDAARTFVPYDEPTRLAAEISSFARADKPERGAPAEVGDARTTPDLEASHS